MYSSSSDGITVTALINLSDTDAQIESLWPGWPIFIAMYLAERHNLDGHQTSALEELMVQMENDESTETTMLYEELSYEYGFYAVDSNYLDVLRSEHAQLPVGEERFHELRDAITWEAIRMRSVTVGPFLYQPTPDDQCRLGYISRSTSPTTIAQLRPSAPISESTLVWLHSL